MNRFSHFLQYHNAVPIALGILMLGAGATFAATNPEAIYSATSEVVTSDNTYIAQKDLSSYSPRVLITGVTEDGENYFVAYDFFTIDLKDYVWQDVVKNETLTVSKDVLGPYRDLGLYVTEQLKQKTDRELAYLQEVQGIERNNVTQKVVATSYGGLVGKFLDRSTETLPGYTPVVTPPPPPSQTASIATSVDQGRQESGSATQNTDTLKIGLQLLGNNPARIALNTNYIDLGAALIDPYHTNVGIHVFQDDKEVISPSIDTSTTSVQTIEYRATDPSGAVVMVRRVVLVGEAVDPGTGISSAGNVTVATPAPAPSETPGSTPTPTTTPSATTSTTSAPTSAASSTPATESATTTPAIDSGAATSTATTTAATEPGSTEPIASTTPAQDQGAASSTPSASASSTATTTAQ